MKIYVEMFLDHNLGDDLFLDTLLTRYPNHDFYLDLPLGMEINHYFKKYKNLKINSKKLNLKNKIINKFSRYTFIYYLNQCLKYDMQILIGGSLFEVRNNKHLLRRKVYYLGYKLQKLLKLKKIIIGSNLGPFYNKKSENIIKETLEIFDGMSVRDLKSLKYLEKWKLDKEKYKYGSDIVFSNKNFNYGEFSIKEVENLLGVSIVNSYSDTNEEKNIYINKMTDIIRLYLKKNKENKVKLLGFDGGVVMSDKDLIEKIYNELTEHEQKRVSKVIYSPIILLDDYMKEFLECSKIIGGRFHSIVLALKYNKKVLAINYSDKIKYLLEDIGLINNLIEYKELKNYSVINMLEKLEKSENTTITSQYLDSSNNHFYYSDIILRKEKR